MKKYNRRTGIALLLCLVLSLQMCLPPSAALAEEGGNQDGATEILPEIDYSVSGFDVEYDGQPHSITLTVNTPDVTVSYATSDAGSYSGTNPSFTEVGSYMVFFRLEKQGYQSEEGSVGVEINPIDISNQVIAGLKSSYAYTGSPVQFDLPYDKIKEWSIVYVNSDGVPLDTPSDPGSYTVNISGEGGVYRAYVSHTFTIVEGKEEIQYTASGYSGVYDGSPHAITVNVTNEGATVTYATSADGTYSETNPAYTDAGEYTVYFKIEKQDCETKTGSATVTITKADVSDQMVFDGESFYTYTGSPVNFSISCAGIDTWTYTYYENDTKLDAAPGVVGSYTVEISGEGANHIAKVEHSYSIIAAEIQYTASEYTGVYDGKAHTITVNILSEGVSATYATSEDGPYTSVLPKFNNSGEYTVWFRLEGTGYRTVAGSATVTIERHDVSATNVTEFPTRILCGAPVSFTPKLNIADHVNDVSWTFTYYDENGDALAGVPTLPGKYSVDMNGEGTNCYARLHHEFTILSGMRPIDYSVQGYSGDYDGKPHTISLNVASDFVTVSYAASQDGPFTEIPLAFTDAGSYTVWYKLEGPLYNTVVKSAAVQIEPLQIRHGSSGYYGVYDGEAHTIKLNVSTEDVTVTYATSEDGEYTAELPYFTDAGEYAVWFKLEKKNYTTVIKGRNVSISKVDVSDQVSFNGESIYPYTGKSVKFSASCEGITRWRYAYFDENNARLDAAPSEPGSYRVEISGEGANCFANLSHAFSIAPKRTKLEIEFTASGYIGVYDAQPHSIALNVTTPGVTVTYATALEGPFTAELPMFTEPGRYVVIYRLERAGYQSITRTEDVMIQPPQPIRHTASGYSGVYDGEAHTIELNVAAEGVAVTYATSEDGPYSVELPTFTDPGEYTVWFRLEKEYSITTTGSASVNIAKIDVSDQVAITAEESYVYNAKPVPIEAVLNGELPFGDSMELTLSCCNSDGNMFPGAPIDVGTYSVTASGEGKYCYASSSCNVEIVPPASLLPMEYSVQGYSGYFDGKPHSITVDVATQGATLSYATSENSGYTDENPGFTKPGAYTVYYKIEKEYYTTVTGFAVVEILEHKDKITYAVEGYSGVYDHKAHTIDLQVITPDVKVTYATSEDGKYRDTPPEYAKPGSYTVWYKLEKSGFETCTGSATITIEKAEQTLYFKRSSVKMFPSAFGPTYDSTVTLVRSEDGGALSYSSSDPDRILIAFYQDTDIIESAIYYASYEEWLNGYVAVITATAAETDCYKAATATYTVMADLDNIANLGFKVDLETSLDKSRADEGNTNDPVTLPKLDENIDMTLRPVSDQDSNSLLGLSSTLRKKLMAAAGEGQIGTMAVDACLTDSQTGEEIHNISGDVLLSFTGDLQQRYLENYENMSCIAVHIEQDSTSSPTVTPTVTPTPGPTVAPTATDAKGVYADSPNFDMSGGIVSSMTTATGGVYADSSSFYMSGGIISPTVTPTPSPTVTPMATPTPSFDGEQLLVTTSDGLTVKPVGSFSPKVEFIPCKLTSKGVLIPDTTTSPFLLIYGPKEAFSNLLTVRAKDGVFTWDGEGHQVAAEPSIAEGTTLWYSVDLETWQTEAPVFTDVLRNEDGSVGSYQVYVLAENPDCDPAVCSYTVTINPAE
ncbi:hypothetical protein [Blautia sp. HCP3S3_C4]|uniref:hypothetical protein n=1 Tax=Blautia sp. HCP3S3_C4 TaxID=3438911 RepID=UPI003F896680